MAIAMAIDIAIITTITIISISIEKQIINWIQSPKTEDRDCEDHDDELRLVL